MRQVMPHRNNIAVHRTKCKRFFQRGARPERWNEVCFAVYCALKMRHVPIAFRYNHTKQGFMETVGVVAIDSLIQIGMAHMHFSQDHRGFGGRPA